MAPQAPRAAFSGPSGTKTHSSLMPARRAAALTASTVGPVARPLAFGGALAVATLTSAFLFGAMLTLIARLGLNHAQAYAALGSAGYKHFARLRVRFGAAEEGSAPRSQIDAWIIGVVDPIADARPILVDSFTWDPGGQRPV